MPRSSRRGLARAPYQVALVAALVVGVGCSAHSHASGARQGPSVSAASPAHVAQAEALPALTRKATVAYDLRVAAGPTARPGQPCVATVQVIAKKPYEITADYPAQLTVRSGDLRQRLTAADASIEAERLTFTPTLAFDRPGRYEVSGELRFSLCDRQSCLLRRESVSWTVHVPGSP
ncbi:MAG: hypothetical protein IPL40_12640 [Proteobacteria bacterium]|nr:hypothetical protein [Pseudomonadota bacterium]